MKSNFENTNSNSERIPAYSDLEKGMSQSDFHQANAELQSNLRAAASKSLEEKESESKEVFLIFKSNQDQKRAMDLLESREFYDELKNVENFCIDPERMDRGIRVDFFKTTENYLEKVKALFAREGMEVTETYTASMPNKNVIEMPKREFINETDEDSYRKAA